jgi:3-hydroxyacyl-CoA dehydrogenase/enoyl-CoA hydratase/3-hydroxybutyryl-CoA epimerase
LVIEAIWENAEAKRVLFDSLDKVLPEDVLLTSNTSSIPLKEIFTNPAREKYTCGLHFFFPTSLKNIVEINIPDGHDAALLVKLKSFLNQIERRFLVLPTPTHFLLNRLLLDIQQQAMQIHITDHIDVREIDALVRKYIFPMGIFEFFDHVGLDVMLASVKNYEQIPGTDKDFSMLIQGLEAQVTMGNLGIKTGNGFYSYPLIPGPWLCTLSESIQAQLVHQLETAYFQTILVFLEKKIVDPADLDYAIMEYWGENLSLMDKFKDKGF